MLCKLKFCNFIAVYYSLPSRALHRKQTSVNLFSEKSKIKFTVLPGLEFVYIHRSRMALLQWGWQKKTFFKLNMSQECSQQGRASSECGLGLLGLMKRWWFNNRLLKRDRYNSLSWREIIVRTEPNFSFEADAGARGNIKNCSLAGSDQRLAKEFISKKVVQPPAKCPESHRMVSLADTSC